MFWARGFPLAVPWTAWQSIIYVHTVHTYVGVYFRLQARMLEGQVYNYV